MPCCRQAALPAAFGLLPTPWLFDRSLPIAAAVAVFALEFLFLALRIGLVSGVNIAQVGWLDDVFASAAALRL